MTLRLYNTKSRRVEAFTPGEPGRVRMYVCGPSVYDRLHVGHGRSYVFYDVVKRYFLWKGLDVAHVQNFTDVEESIAERSAKEGVPPLEYAERFIASFFEDTDALHVLRATAYPRVSEHVDEIQRIVDDLQERDVAYIVDCREGSMRGEPARVCDVYFDVHKWPGFGSLVGQKPDELMVDDPPVSGDRRHPMDFALWKSKDDWGMTWPSEWGDGRPGWHVECTAMALKHLGPDFDIHGGGLDLVFPHHESEMAIAEAWTGKTYARVFLHNGFVTVNAQKMSKSTGNFVTLQDLLKRYEPEVVRLFLAGAHYREPLDFDETAIARTRDRLESWKRAIAHARHAGADAGTGPDPLADERARFEDGVEDDFHLDRALNAVDEAAEKTIGLAGADAARALAFFEDVARVVGVPFELDRKG